MSRRGAQRSNGFLLAMHTGAGRRSSSSAKASVELLRQAMKIVGDTLPNDAKAADVVVSAVSLLEDSPITNAGVGSSLTFDGRVECDASICVSDGSVGAIGAVEGVRNPGLLANRVREAACNRGPCGLVNPVVITGSGGQAWAAQCGMLVDPKCHMTASTSNTWREYVDQLTTPQEHVGDTVGVVCLDSAGTLASAASSGGNWLKPSGRLGAAAVPNAAAAQFGECATAASGIGEHMIRESFALRCAMNISSGRSEDISALSCACSAGMIAVCRRQGADCAELIFGHATESFCYGYYSPESMAAPLCVASSSSSGKYVVSGYRIRRTEST